jgi:ABC-type branched-subunit amino acid transport system ATPase component/predicted MFS family arabinose efflux permease
VSAPGGDATTEVDLAGIAAGVLTGEAERLDAAASAGPADLDVTKLPGVADEAISLRRGLALGGGAFPFLVLLLLNSLDELETAAMSVLGPDIGTSLGVSDGVIVFITSASAAFVVLGIIPMGWMADRMRRAPIIGWCSLLFGAMAAASAGAVNAFMLFWTRFGSGIAKANTVPVHASLLADTYPISVRGRVSSLVGTAGRVTGVASPVLVGAIAAWFGGAEHGGWRWAFLLLGVPVAFAAFLAFRIPEPPRGQWERRSVLGTVPADDADMPISVEMVFGRLLQITTLRTMVFALAAIGFQMFPMVSLTNFFLRDTYGLDAFHRGLVASAGGALTIVVLPLVGRWFDRTYRTDPARSMKIIAALILPGALLAPLQFNMPNAVLFTILSVPGLVLVGSAFTMVGPIIQAVIPYRLRSLGIAFAALYVFLFGAVGGALLGAGLASSFGNKVAILAIAIPSSIAGAVFLLRGAGSITADLAMVVADIEEEEAERSRQSEAPEDIPALQLAGIDFAYDSVQVLFDVDLQVARGETLALLGTNGAGKSTILRVVAGLENPSRGAVRLDGRTITFTSAEQRAGMGIALLPGGRGVFPTMTVAENLDVGATTVPADERAGRIERVWDLFPDLADRRRQRAGSLSGGQQQQLALGRVLLHDPHLLLIDELSLGLAPAVVEDLLATLDRLKAAGQTMVIVEQSLNVAVAIADRAVFLEKGSVRFDGTPRDLLERDDLARAIFLGGDR